MLLAIPLLVSTQREYSYLSLEFLLGRTDNAMLNMGVKEEYTKALRNSDSPLILSVKKSQRRCSRGNGESGRLAVCYMDPMDGHNKLPCLDTVCDTNDKVKPSHKVRYLSAKDCWWISNRVFQIIGLISATWEIQRLLWSSFVWWSCSSIGNICVIILDWDTSGDLKYVWLEE
jgi:hypothetical protein